MPGTSFPPQARGQQHFHPTALLRVLTYGLFVFSTFSIAGDEGFAILLMLMAIWQWGQMRREGAAPAPLPWWIYAPFLALALVGVLSALVNPEILDTLNHMRGKYKLFLPFALLLSLEQVHLKRLLGAQGVWVALMAIYGVIQFRWGVDWFRAEGLKLITPYDAAPGYFLAKGNFSHHLTFAGYMLIVTPLFLSLGMRGRRRQHRGWRTLDWQRWAWLAVGGLAALAVLVSLGRSGWLGMGAGVLLLLALRLHGRWRLGLAAAGLAAVALVIALLSTSWPREHLLRPDSPTLLKRFLLTSPSFDVDRLRLWEAGWLAIRDRPLLGFGFGNQDRDFETYRQAVASRYGGYHYTVEAGAGIHNIYLQLVFNLGWTGLAAYLACWGAVFAWGARALRQAAPTQAAEFGAADMEAAEFETAEFKTALLRGCLAGLAGSMVAGFFENNALDGEVETLILMVMGLVLFLGQRRRRDNVRQGTGDRAW